MPDTIATTLGALVQAEPALVRLAELRVPVKPAYHLSKLLRLVRQEIVHFNELRNGFVKELGVERDPTPEEAMMNGGQPVTAVDPPGARGATVASSAKWPEFVTRMNELAAQPVEIPWRPIDLATLGNVNVSAADLAALDALAFLSDDPVKETTPA